MSSPLPGSPRAWIVAAALLVSGACTKSNVGSDCAIDRSCPDGLKCFPDFRCYPKTADPACDPPCYGTEPLCDKSTLRCVACLTDGDCGPGQLCKPPLQVCSPGCSATHPSCAEATTHCDVALGVCRGCNADAECTDAAHPRCDLSAGTCEACSLDGGDCAAGQYCDRVSGHLVCVPGCLDSAQCQDGGTATMACCNARCVDTASSGANCGGCNLPCPGNESCCGSQCFDLSSDPDNCNACGATCALPNVAGPSCTNGVCSHLGCESYFGDCDHDLATNGCETNLSYDPNNCTNCGHVCPSLPNRPGTCSLGACGYGGCDAGFGDCDGQFGTGCETPLGTAQNCGGCNDACDAGQSCDAGQCV